MEFVHLSIDEATMLAQAAFENAGASRENSQPTAQALVQAEIDGQVGHGLARVPSYVAQLTSGKVNPAAAPQKSLTPGKAIVGIDADHGFAYRAINLAIDEITPLAKTFGIAGAAIYRSHHFGQAGAHAERLAHHGLVSLVFGNSPKAIAFWGAKNPSMGTNPIAFSAPMPDGPPLVIDLALSVAARGKILSAQKTNTPIPPDWALDQHGEPTTDPDAALSGSMMPLGGAKGAALALMIEVLAAALTGSAFGFEASSLFDGDGPAPNLGQTLIAIDPEFGGHGNFLDRMTVLASEIDQAHGARMPGTGRLDHRERAATDGLRVSSELHREIVALAETHK